MKPNMPRGASLEDLVIQQRMTNRLLVMLVRKPQHEVIEALKATEATDEEISQVVGTTPATVTQTLHRKRKGDAAKAGTQAGQHGGDDPLADGSEKGDGPGVQPTEDAGGAGAAG